MPFHQGDNYTPIHNDVLEALMLVNLTAYETRVLFAVWRKTYGYVDKNTGKQKKIDWIPLSQFVSMTGISKQNVNRTLHVLEHRRLIKRDTGGKIGFSKDFINKSKVLAKTVPPLKRRTGGMKPIGEILAKKRGR